jgi:hypothetical protein
MKSLFAVRAGPPAPNLIRWCLLAIFSMAAAALATATMVIPPAFDKLVGQADYVVRTVVKSVTAEFRGEGQNRHIVTKVEMDVREVICGTPPEPLVLEMLGGEVGGQAMVVAGAPRFKVGDEDILFVHGNGRQISPLVALMHGRYPIKRDDAGNEYVARGNGAPLYDHQEVALPMGEASPVKAVQLSAKPLAPAEFASRIKAARVAVDRPALQP